MKKERMKERTLEKRRWT